MPRFLRLGVAVCFLLLIAFSAGQTNSAQSKKSQPMSKDFRKSARLSTDEFQAVLRGERPRLERALSLMGQAQIDASTPGDRSGYKCLQKLANRVSSYLSEEMEFEKVNDQAHEECNKMRVGSQERVACLGAILQDMPRRAVKPTTSYNIAVRCAKFLDGMLGTGQFTGMGECAEE